MHLIVLAELWWRGGVPCNLGGVSNFFTIWSVTNMVETFVLTTSVQSVKPILYRCGENKWEPPPPRLVVTPKYCYKQHKSIHDNSLTHSLSPQWWWNNDEQYLATISQLNVLPDTVRCIYLSRLFKLEVEYRLRQYRQHYSHIMAKGKPVSIFAHYISFGGLNPGLQSQSFNNNDT